MAEYPLTTSSANMHDEIYMKGARLVWPHILLSDRRTKSLDDAERSEVDNGIGVLEQALRVRPNDFRNWATLWLMGKGYEALGKYEKSYQKFWRAFQVHPNGVDVAREFMASCLKTGRTSQAVVAAKAASKLAPSDRTIAGNLALALLTDGSVAEAFELAREVLGRWPGDELATLVLEKAKVSM